MGKNQIGWGEVSQPEPKPGWGDVAPPGEIDWGRVVKPPELSFAARNPRLAALAETFAELPGQIFSKRNLLGSLELAGRPFTASESALMRYAKRGSEAGPIEGVIAGGKQFWETFTAPAGESKIYTPREYYKEVAGEDPPVWYEWLWHTSTGLLWGLAGQAYRGPQAFKAPLSKKELEYGTVIERGRRIKTITKQKERARTIRGWEPIEPWYKKRVEAEKWEPFTPWYEKEAKFVGKKPHQGLRPGTKQWTDKFTKASPLAQEEMLQYKDNARNAETYIFGGGEAMPNPLPKYAGSINLNRIEAADDVKKLILDVSKGIPKKHMTLEEIHEIAHEMAMPLSKIKKMRKVTDQLSAEVMASREVMNQSAREVVEAQKAYLATPTDYNLAEFTLKFNRHGQLQSDVSGTVSEIGRTMSALRRHAETKPVEIKAIDDILEAFGGKEINLERLHRLAQMDLSDTRAINQFIRDSYKATTGDMIYEAWINAILSGFQTHAVNTTSNAFVRLFTIPEKGIRVPIDYLRSKITGTPRERFLDEMTADIFGMVEGTKQGARRGLDALIREIPEGGISKLELARRKAIPGVPGEVIRIPGKALIAEDEFFKAINYHAELRSLAARQAVKEGLKGKGRATRIAEILANPSQELVEKASKEMLYRVFQQPLGPFGKWLNRARTSKEWPVISTVAKYIVPFLRTPINIAKYGLERTPANFLRIGIKGARKELMGGELVDEVAKATTGSILGLTTLLYAREGKITGGGPREKGRREAWYRTGKQQYSVRIGDKWYSFGRFEPLGMVMGLVADASEIWDELGDVERGELAGLISLAITKNLANKTFLRGLRDAFNAIEDPVRYGARWEYNFVGSWVPNIVATTARALDPGLKRPETIDEAFKQRVPILREQVKTQLDLWGKEIEPGNAMTFFHRLLSPMYISKASESPIDKEILRMKLDIRMPGKNVMGVPLNNEEYWFFIETAGRYSKQKLDELVKSSQYLRANDVIRTKMIQEHITAGRQIAIGQLLTRMNPQRAQLFQSEMVKRQAGEQPTKVMTVP